MRRRFQTACPASSDEQIPRLEQRNAIGMLTPELQIQLSISEDNEGIFGAGRGKHAREHRHGAGLYRDRNADLLQPENYSCCIAPPVIVDAEEWSTDTF